MAARATLLSGLTIAEDTAAAAEGAPPLHLFNQMTKKKELFVPREEGKVGMYVCGVTPYASSHVGHARAYVAFDVLYRYLKSLGYQVTYVRNFTDIDDKIIKRAKENGETVTSLSSRFINEFLADVAELQCLPPTHQPRVTEHIDLIMELIAKIIKNDKGYVVEGNVYFSVDSYPEYLSLFGRSLDDNLDGSRVDVDPRKRNHKDFALWKVKLITGGAPWRRPPIGLLFTSTCCQSSTAEQEERGLTASFLFPAIYTSPLQCIGWVVAIFVCWLCDR